MASVQGPVAFVLPGGGTWGAVQVGMLRALTERRIVPDLLVGTSVGALNAAVYAAAPDGGGVAALTEAWCSARRAQIFPIGPVAVARAVVARRGHLLANDGLHRWIVDHLPFGRLEHAPVPLHVMATDVATRQAVMLSAGDATLALMASSAIPGVFPPVTVAGRLLCDGGVSANRPVPQALGLGAGTVFELSTRGTGRTHRGRRARLREARGLRRGHDTGPQGATGPSWGPAVHVLPAPATTDLNPFSFRHSRHLIDQATHLAAAWLAEHLGHSDGGDVPLLAETVAQVEEHPA